MKFICLFVCFILVSQCSCKSLPKEQESVVSIYTTPATSQAGPLDVYQQIFNNVAERIATPFYRFLNNIQEENTTTNKNSTAKSNAYEDIEILDDPETPANTSVDPKNNDIPERDTEEVTIDPTRKRHRKPHRLIKTTTTTEPTTKKHKKHHKSSKTTTTTEPTTTDFPTDNVDDLESRVVDFDDDDDSFFKLDDVDSIEEEREAGFIYYLELIGSFFQLVYGAIAALFQGSH